MTPNPESAVWNIYLTGVLDIPKPLNNVLFEYNHNAGYFCCRLRARCLTTSQLIRFLAMNNLEIPFTSSTVLSARDSHEMGGYKSTHGNYPFARLKSKPTRAGTFHGYAFLLLRHRLVDGVGRETYGTLIEREWSRAARFIEDNLVHQDLRILPPKTMQTRLHVALL